MEMKYDGYMDDECIPLCDALNSILGIRTTESCCGHGGDSFCIWFYLWNKNKINYLNVVARVFDVRYGGIDGWTCELENSDVPEHTPAFKIDSNGIKGKQAYEDSEVITENIKNHLSHKNFMETFILRRR